MPRLEPQTPSKLKTVSPEFAVPDVVAAAQYYRDALGFRILGYFLDPPVYAIVARDGVEVHFGGLDPGAIHSPNSNRREGGLDAYIWVSDLDSLFAELTARGAKVVEPALRIYKCYEMVVEDNFGFRLAFSMDVSSA